MSLKKLASLIIKINANGAQAQAELKTLEKKVSDFGKSMKRVGQNMTKYVTVPLVGIAALSVKAANTQLQAEAKLLNALKGREDVQKRLMEQASKTQSRTLFGNEAIIEQQAYLAALGLSEQQINDTIEAAVQLSAALGMDLTSAVKNLAKTYGGMTGELGESIPALKNFTQEQLKAGDAIGYVNANYQGFAESVAQAGSNENTQRLNKLRDIAERFGTILIPVMDKVLVVLDEFVDVLSKLPEGAQTAVVGLGVFLAALGPLISGMGSIASAISSLGPLASKAGSSIASAFGKNGPAFLAVAALLAMLIEHLNAMNRIERWTEEFEAEQREEMNSYASAAYKNYLSKYTDKKYPFSLEQLKQMRDKEVALAAAMRKYVNSENRTKEEEQLLYKYFFKNLTGAEADADIRASLPQKEASISGWNLAIEQIEQGTIKRELEQVEITVETTIGLIERLKQRISDLEDKKPFATTEEELRKINGELDTLHQELDRLNNLKPVGEIVALEKVATSPINWGDVEMKGDFALEWGPLSQRNFEGWRKTQLERAKRMVETVNEMNAILTEALVNFAETSFDMLADLFTGQEIKPLASFLEMIGNLLKQLGKALITYGGLIEAFRKTFSNPWVSIAVGAAAIAAGAAFTALAKRPFAQNTVKLANGGLAYGPTMAVVGDNPGAANDPEVIAPLSKLRNYMGRQKLELTGEIEWEMRGDVLRAVLDRNNVRLATLG
jgi:hypothetical protein